MGSCFSEPENVPEKETRVPPRTANKHGNVLGGAPNTKSSRLAAGEAAQLRYDAQQLQLAQSKQKLKAMEKILKKEKGLA